MVHPNNYLIEIRLMGKAKYDVRKMIYHLQRRFRLPIGKKVPHITLAGPFTTSDESALVRDFGAICRQAPTMWFGIDGFDTFPDTHVVHLAVKPSAELRAFRLKTARTLQSYCRLQRFDYQADFKFHATLAMKLDRLTFDRVRQHAHTMKCPQIRHTVLRVTLLRGGRILREYDFLQRRMLSRQQALDPNVYARTMTCLRRRYADRGIQHASERRSVSWWSKLKWWFRQ